MTEKPFLDNLQDALKKPGLPPQRFAALAEALARRSGTAEDRERAEAMSRFVLGKADDPEALREICRCSPEFPSPWDWFTKAVFSIGEEDGERWGTLPPSPGFWAFAVTHWTGWAARTALARRSRLFAAARRYLVRWLTEGPTGFDDPAAAESYALQQALLSLEELSSLRDNLGEASRTRFDEICRHRLPPSGPAFLQGLETGTVAGPSQASRPEVVCLFDADALSAAQVTSLTRICSEKLGRPRRCIAARNRPWGESPPEGVELRLAGPERNAADYLLIEAAQEALRETPPDTQLVLVTTDTDLVPALDQWQRMGRETHLLCPRPLASDHGVIRAFRMHGARVHSILTGSQKVEKPLQTGT